MPKSPPRSRNRSSSPRRSRDRVRETDGSGKPASEWLSGFHSVREALRANRRPLDRLWLRDDRPQAVHDELADLARRRGVLVETVAAARLSDQVGPEGNHQGIALRAGAIPELSLGALIDVAASTADAQKSRFVALDGVEDPQNVGALARVAESAGVQGLILTDRRAPELTAAVSRASAGAIEWLPVARVSNLRQGLQRLQKNGYWIVSAGLDADEGIFALEDRALTGNLTVVLGAEGKGVRRSILEQSDHVIEIPMRGRISSLNVSTAGAIILYDLLRRSEAAED